MEPGGIVAFIRVLGDRYVRACQARDDLSTRLEALNRRRRADETSESDVDGEIDSFDEVADIEGVRAVLYRSTRVWTDRTRAMEAIVTSVVVEARHELPAGWSPAQLRPEPAAPSPLPSVGSEPTRGWWAWP